MSFGTPWMRWIGSALQHGPTPAVLETVLGFEIRVEPGRVTAAPGITQTPSQPTCVQPERWQPPVPRQGGAQIPRHGGEPVPCVAARATAVVRFLQDRGGVAPERLGGCGYSAYRSVATNDTAEGRRQNRRIELVLIPPR